MDSGSEGGKREPSFNFRQVRYIHLRENILRKRINASLLSPAMSGILGLVSEKIDIIS